MVVLVVADDPLLDGRPRRPPGLGSRREVEGHDVVGVEEEHPVVTRREEGVGEPAQLVVVGGDALVALPLPQDGPGAGVDRQDVLPGLVARDVPGQDQPALVAEDLRRVAGALIRPEGLPCRCVEGDDGRVEAEGDVDDAADRDEAPLELKRPLESHVAGELGLRPRPPAPVRDGTLPEEQAVEGVSRVERPPVGHALGADRTLVDDGEQPPLRRHHGAQARQQVVMPRPERAHEPLEVAGDADPPVARHRVAVGAVEPVSPLVHVCWPGLRARRPLAAPPDAGDAAGGEHPQDLVLGDARCIVHDDEIDQVVDVGQAPAVEGIHRHLPIEAERLDVLPGLLDLRTVGVQALNHTAIAGTQSRRHPAVAAAEMDDQPALDARGGEDLFRSQRRASPRVWRSSEKSQGDEAGDGNPGRAMAFGHRGLPGRAGYFVSPAMQRIFPSVVARYSRPLAAMRPSKAGGDASACSVTSAPSAAEKTWSLAPLRPSNAA